MMKGHQKTANSHIVEVVRQRIRRLRLQRGLTQENLCDRAGISVDAVSRIENGSRKPTLDTLDRIAQALDTSISELVSTGELPKTQYPATLMRIISLLEAQPAHVHQTIETIVKVVMKAIAIRAASAPSKAAEEKAPYQTKK
ncbi:MAG: helix-turn-helix transcriptional regulator [Myxococcota bacterium]|nr:helix-turn-helix transcriptional regulator [Myxococcota bacterium]